MNMQSSVLKVSVILVGFLCYGALFGMENDQNQTLVVCDNKLTKALGLYLPIEIIVNIAACVDEATKDTMRMTCKYLHATASPTNVRFVANPLFTASPNRINSMALYNGWYGNQDVMEVLKKHLPGDGSVALKNFMICDLAGTGITGSYKIFKLGDLCQLGSKYIFNLAKKKEEDPLLDVIFRNQFFYEGLDLGQFLNQHNYNDSIPEVKIAKEKIDLALLCAALCDDTQAIQNIAPMIKILYIKAHGEGKNEVYKSIMMVLVKRNNKQAFEFMVQNDPYEIRKYHADGLSNYEWTLLDTLNNTKYKNIDEYKAICEKYGEKTTSEQYDGKKAYEGCIVS